MSSNERSDKQLDTTYPTLQGEEVPSSSSSIQSKEAEQRFGHDVEKSMAIGDGEEKTNQSPSKPGSDPGACPDGGFHAWLAVAGGFCTIFASFGWINCRNIPSNSTTLQRLTKILVGIGIFQNYYQNNQLKSYSSSTISWIPSTESFMLFFFVSPSKNPQPRPSLTHQIGTCCWKDVRYDWTKMADTVGLNSPRFRPDDDFHLSQILSNISRPKYLQCYWM